MRGAAKLWERARAVACRTVVGSAQPKKQITICGFPRGGTSLLYNMMAASLEEFRCEPFEVTALDSIWKYEDTLSKQPYDILHVGRLPSRNVHHKDLCVIIVVRDLRDVITSVHPRYPDRYFIGYEGSVPGGGENGSPAWRLAGVKRIYDEINRVLKSEDLTCEVVRYEDLVEDPECVAERLQARFGLAFARPFSDFYKAADRLPYRYDRSGMTKEVAEEYVREDKPVDGQRRGKWRQPKHAARIRTEFTRHPELFDMLRALGYEHDDGWYATYESSAPAAAGTNTSNGESPA